MKGGIKVMAEYTITLEHCISLFNPEQISEYDTIWQKIEEQTFRNRLKTIFENYYQEYEISRGTPLGFLKDFSVIMNLNCQWANDIINKIKSDGYFSDNDEGSTITETFGYNNNTTNSGTDTSNNSTSNKSVTTSVPFDGGEVNFNFGKENGVDGYSNGYADSGVKSLSTGNSSFTHGKNVAKTGEDTHNTNITLKKSDGSANELLKNMIVSFEYEFIKKFKPIFMLIFQAVV